MKHAPDPGGSLPGTGRQWPAVAAQPAQAAYAPVRAFMNCTAMRKVNAYRGGIKRVGAHDRRAPGVAQYKPYVSTKRYRLNALSDRDKDGVACEPRHHLTWSNNFMIRNTWTARALIGSLVALVAATGLTGVAAPASAASTMSTRYLLNHLENGREHVAGYDRAKFRLWVDADGDGCDTRDEVLISEAQIKPRIRSGCELRRGRWFSRYDGVATRDASTFDIDHLVPLNEAWQSGAWTWSPATRRAYANDLGYQASLIAVSAHSNRSKGDREPQDWMPDRRAYACTYLNH